MARAILGLLVVGMLSLTGYYAYSTIGHSDDTPSATSVDTHKMGCCSESAAKKCCSESSDPAGCTGECPHSGATATGCPADGGCCKDKAKTAEAAPAPAPGKE